MSFRVIMLIIMIIILIRKYYGRPSFAPFAGSSRKYRIQK